MVIAKIGKNIKQRHRINTSRHENIIISMLVEMKIGIVLGRCNMIVKIANAFKKVYQDSKFNQEKYYQVQINYNSRTSKGNEKKIYS